MSSLKRNPLWLLLTCIGMFAIAVGPATTCWCATYAVPTGATATASPVMPCCASQPAMHGACCKHQSKAKATHRSTSNNQSTTKLHCSLADSSHAATHPCGGQAPDAPQWTQTQSGTLRPGAPTVTALPLQPLSLNVPTKSCLLCIERDEGPPFSVPVPASPARAPPVL